MTETAHQSHAESTETPTTTQPLPKGWIGLGIALLFAVLFYFFCGFYTIQPIGALPDGATAIVWREGDEPFFNSPDATCLRRTGSVSLMCRGMAMIVAPTDRIIMRLPYLEFAYVLSTRGKEFDR